MKRFVVAISLLLLAFASTAVAQENRPFTIEDNSRCAGWPIRECRPMAKA